jgi:membrane-bound lytic murein transglycosylase B
MLKHTLGFVLILTSGIACASSAPSVTQPETPEARPSLVLDDVRMNTKNYLLNQGVPANFIEEIELKYTKKKNWIQDSLKLVEPNVFGFLYQGNYLKHDSKRARRKTYRYLLAHKNSFLTAQTRYQVSPESIAALLWVETKLGNHMGSHPLPFVFYSIALASEASVCQEMEKLVEPKLAVSTLSEKPDPANAIKKLVERCKQKSEWAASELKVLSSLHEKGKLNAFELRGSFAGAFGIPQFLPSSYEKYAVSDFRKKPNLFLISDAILSVGNFLKQNGWKADSADSQNSALYAYNRSKDYGTVIRQIAERLDEI